MANGTGHNAHSMSIHKSLVFGGTSKMVGFGGASNMVGVGGASKMIGLGGTSKLVSVGGASKQMGSGGASQTRHCTFEAPSSHDGTHTETHRHIDT